jgi:hypothetical protein
MNYCKTCRYWKSPWGRSKILGVCDRIETEENTAPLITDRAVIRYRVSDDIGFNANLVTMEAFGCVLHVPHRVKTVEKFEYR